MTALAHWYLIDRIGRRISIAIGALGMAVCLCKLSGPGRLCCQSADICSHHRSSRCKFRYQLIRCPVEQYLSHHPIHCFVSRDTRNQLIVRSCQVFFVGQILVVAGEILPNEIRSTVSSFGRAALTIGNIILAVATPRWFEISDVSVMFTLGGFNRQYRHRLNADRSSD